MGRKSLLENQLTDGRVLSFLLERDEAKEKQKISRKLLLRLYKSKQSDRKKKCFEDMDNLLKRLCSDSCDKTENLKKLYAAAQKCSHQNKKRVEAEELLLEETRKNKKLVDIERRLQEERQLRFKIEHDYGKLLSENTALENELQELKNVVFKLKNKKKKV